MCVAGWVHGSQLTALEIYIAAYGEKHPDVGQTYYNMGEVYQNQGKYDLALEYYGKALDVKTSLFCDVFRAKIRMF